jgi:hypothetical protein
MATILKQVTEILLLYGISYTTSSSAMPRSNVSCRTGSSPIVLRIDDEPGYSTTGLVAQILCDAASPCTREAMFTVWPK